jgi:hypothetical protein
MQYFFAYVIIMITGITSVFLSGSIFSGYHFMDCSLFTQIIQTVQETSWLESLTSFIKFDGGRFRPLFWIYLQVVSCLPWGDNMFAQGLVKILLNIIAAFILYVTGRNINWTHRDSLLFAGLTMLGTQSAIFYQTVSQETTGLLLWALSLYGLAKYVYTSNKIRRWYYALFVLTSLGAALTKESFILVLPAGYIFYGMLYSENHSTDFLNTLLRTWKTGLFLCLLTVAGLAAVLAFAGNGAMDTHSGLKPYLKALLYLYGISGGVVLAIAGTFYLLWRTKTNLSSWIYPLLLFLFITVPQIVLYASSGIVDRYLIPAIAGCAFFAVYVSRRLKSEDKMINGLLWKNISLGLGLVMIMACTFIVFDNSMQQKVVNFAFYLQGQGWQKMTAVSSLQYLLSTVPTMAIAGILAGIIMVSWGMRRFTVGHGVRGFGMIFVGGGQFPYHKFTLED